MKTYASLLENIRQKGTLLAVLIDPDDTNEEKTQHIVSQSVESGVDLFLIGGSLITNNNLREISKIIKSNSDIPLLIFPGGISQVHPEADALLFLSLISGRNPDFLIGQQVLAAPHIKRLGIEAIPTGYMLIDGGRQTTANYISNTMPIPHDKKDIAATTALAGELMGHKLIYMDAGSGAARTISPEMIKEVKRHIQIPLIIGGGIKSEETLKPILKARPDIIVIGNVLEKQPGLIKNFASLVHTP
jgi:putative glycerol-1-phosphate prenyltransferase